MIIRIRVKLFWLIFISAIIIFGFIYYPLSQRNAFEYSGVMVWSKDGKSLFYLRNGICRLDLLNNRHTRYRYSGLLGRFDVSPDGKSIVYKKLVEDKRRGLNGFEITIADLSTWSSHSIYRVLNDSTYNESIYWVGKNYIVFYERTKSRDLDTVVINTNGQLVKRISRATPCIASCNDNAFVYRKSNGDLYRYDLAKLCNTKLSIESYAYPIFMSRHQLVYWYRHERYIVKTIRFSNSKTTQLYWPTECTGEMAISPSLRKFYRHLYSKGEWSPGNRYSVSDTPLCTVRILNAYENGHPK